MDAIRRSGLEPKLISAGGGSDANILNGKGLPAVNIALGMEKVHTPSERIAVGHLAKASEIVYQLMTMNSV
jgi:tripeptide aminopeptidase